MANHGGKGARRRHQERRKLLIQSKPSTYSRSEEGIRYQYNNHIATLFAGWSKLKRDKNITPTFKHFYDELQQECKEQITVTEIFKNNETEKTDYHG